MGPHLLSTHHRTNKVPPCLLLSWSAQRQSMNSIDKRIHSSNPNIRIVYLKGQDRTGSTSRCCSRHRDVGHHQERRSSTRGKAPKKVRHRSERRKRRPKRWNRKTPGCQLKRQHKNAAIENRSIQKMRRRIQLRKIAFCARRKRPLTCRMSHAAYTRKKLKPSSQDLTLKRADWT
jgi:hypothetical protein